MCWLQEELKLPFPALYLILLFHTRSASLGPNTRIVCIQPPKYSTPVCQVARVSRPLQYLRVMLARRPLEQFPLTRPRSPARLNPDAALVGYSNPTSIQTVAVLLWNCMVFAVLIPGRSRSPLAESAPCRDMILQGRDQTKSHKTWMGATAGSHRRAEECWATGPMAKV